MLGAGSLFMKNQKPQKTLVSSRTTTPQDVTNIDRESVLGNVKWVRGTDDSGIVLGVGFLDGKLMSLRSERDCLTVEAKQITLAESAAVMREMLRIEQMFDLCSDASDEGLNKWLSMIEIEAAE